MFGFFYRLVSVSAVFIIILSVNSCNDTPVAQPMPVVFVDEIVNLSSIEALGLQYPNGHLYINGGVRGIVIINQNGNFLAIERACPYKPMHPCERLEVDASNLFMVDKCCGSEFDFNNRIIRGPAILPAHAYRTLKQGNLLYIRNDL